MPRTRKDTIIYDYHLLTIMDINTIMIYHRDILSGRVLTEYNRRKLSNAYKVAEVDQETLFSNMKRRQLTVI